MITLEQARAAKDRLNETIWAIPEVNGIGIGKVGEDYVISVMLVEPTSGTIPDQVDGVAVVTKVVGVIRPL